MFSAIRLKRIQARGPGEHVATMEVVSDERDEDLSQYAGERIVEQFGSPEAHRGYFEDADLNPEFRRQHHGSARYVAQHMQLGRPGTFTVDRRGRFLDFHGGTGLRGENDIEWFTPEALHRGIGWYFVQTYKHNGRAIARFKIIRIITTRGGGRIEVRKIPLR